LDFEVEGQADKIFDLEKAALNDRPFRLHVSGLDRTEDPTSGL